MDTVYQINSKNQVQQLRFVYGQSSFVLQAAELSVHVGTTHSFLTGSGEEFQL